MRNKFLTLAALAALLVCAVSPSAVRAQVPEVAPTQPMMAYMSSIKGQKQGPIRGDVTQRGREGFFQLYDFKHQIVSPRDAASGLPTGKRQHKPVVIMQKVGRGSPLLASALANNENLSEVVFQFWQPNISAAGGVGAEVNYYTIKLTNASISSYRQFFQPNVGLMEEISLTYQKIDWIFQNGGITGQDDWESRL